ncbi:hypothetical protein DMB68_21930 [Flavobacterium hydrophilum]|uniref:Uncharacterized protein n=1 Tax=Flavobacterium hydrophilum TaxID=2211445 RepID=A0A2V4BVN5_9FLAO|nr:hypothetical protein DMB68_21930 [Flavobacterium hydrophilum]
MFCRFYLLGAISGFPFQVLIKKSKVSNVLKELLLVAFLKQETFAFLTPGFTLQSGLETLVL